MSDMPVPPPPTDLHDPHPGKTVVSSARALLRQDKSLSLLPMIGGISSLLAIVPFLAAQLLFDGQTPIQVVLYVLTVFIGTTITTFFSVALCAGAAARMEGGDPTIRSCISVAAGNWWSIVRWGMFAAAVGIVLRLIEERLGGFAGVLLRKLGEISFAAASYFVVPMLAHEQIGPFAALKKSAETIQAQWRRTLRFTLRLGWWGFLIVFGALAVLSASIVGGIALAAAGDGTVPSVAAGIAVAAIGLIIFIYATLYVGAVSAYGRTALYRYATGRPVPGFSPVALQGAVREPRKGLPA